LADATLRLAFGIEAVRQLRDRSREALRDGREVLLVGADQPWVCLGGEVIGKIKRAGSQGSPRLFRVEFGDRNPKPWRS
jgi:hypothetical protein